MMHTLVVGVNLDGRWRQRAVTGVVFILSSGLLCMGSLLEASAKGYGTHEQMRMPPCGFLKVSGLPCATCGMTTAFTHAAHGRLFDAFMTQPAGALIAVAVAATTIVSGYALMVGASMSGLWKLLWRPSVVVAAVVILLGAWAYKITILHGGG